MVDSPSQESDGRLPRRRLACGVFHGMDGKWTYTILLRIPEGAWPPPETVGRPRGRGGLFLPKATTAVAMSHRFPCALCTLLLDYESSVWQRPTPSQ